MTENLVLLFLYKYFMKSGDLLVLKSCTIALYWISSRDSESLTDKLPPFCNRRKMASYTENSMANIISAIAIFHLRTSISTFFHIRQPQSYWCMNFYLCRYTCPWKYLGRFWNRNSLHSSAGRKSNSYFINRNFHLDRRLFGDKKAFSISQYLYLIFWRNLNLFGDSNQIVNFLKPNSFIFEGVIFNLSRNIVPLQNRAWCS